MNKTELYVLAMLAGGIVLFLMSLLCLFARNRTTLTVRLFILAIVMVNLRGVHPFKTGGPEEDGDAKKLDARRSSLKGISVDWFGSGRGKLDSRIRVKRGRNP
jgi:hypothetical protein